MPTSFPNFGAPYRPPCGGWPAKPQLVLGCGNNIISAHQSLQKWTNITKVADYHTDELGDLESPGGIPPYPKPKGSRPPDGTCPGNPTCPSEPPAPDNDDPRCGDWTAAEKPAAIDDATHKTEDRNIYQKTEGQTVDVSQCRKIGFKNVQARKFWHGSFGWLSPERGLVNFNTTCDCLVYEPERPAPDPTKYLKLDATATAGSFEIIDDVLTPMFVSTVHQTVSIVRHTGLLTLDECDEEEGGTDLAAVRELMGMALQSGSEIIQAIWTKWIGIWGEFTMYGYTIDYGCPAPTPMSGKARLMSPAAEEIATLEYDLEAGTASLESVAGDVHVECEISNTILHYEELLYAEPGVSGSRSSVDAVLSVEYTAAELHEDWKGLMAEWNLADDAVYPWRTDGLTNIAPLVTYDEVEAAVVHQFAGDCAGFAPPPEGWYTGNVRGKPLPAGRGPHFDWRHRTWHVCTGDAGKAIFVNSTGAWSNQVNDEDESDRVVPATATQWTENEGAQEEYWPTKFPRHGAWLNYAARTGMLYGQKWAEIKIAWPAQNYARPCGLDRFLPDHTQARCVDEFDGTALELASALAWDPADRLVICGTDFDGLYEIVSGAGTSYVVGAKLQDLPSDLPDDLGAMAAKVRFPAARPICGHIKIASITEDSGEITVVLDEENEYLRVGDQIDFVVYAPVTFERTIISASRTITEMVSPTEIKFSGTAPEATHIISTGAPHYRWNDSKSKGDYVTLEWQFNLRDYQERDRMIAQYEAQGEDCDNPAPDPATPIREGQEPREVSDFFCTTRCLKIPPCAPAVICITPNYDAEAVAPIDDFSELGEVLLFPADFVADDRYGSRWMSSVAQIMPELYWQKPYPCKIYSLLDSFDFTWTPDDGWCATADGIVDPDTGLPVYYYPYPPVVEARCELPVIGTGELAEEAPALPAGITIGCPTVENCRPPQFGGHTFIDGPCTFFSVETVWGLLLREEHCVCTNFRPEMAEAYEDNGAHCR